MELPKKEKMQEDKPFPFFHPLSRRLHLVLLLMMLIFVSSWIRGNLSMTMTCMVNSTAVSLESQSSMATNFNDTSKVFVPATKCGGVTDDDGEAETAAVVNDYGGTIIWSSKKQNLLFSASFYGALITSFPSGYLADRTSPSVLIQLNVIVLIISTALFPYLAENLPYIVVFIFRVFVGAGQGFIIPSINAIIIKWIPNSEKALAVSIYTSGNQIAGIFGMPIAAAFCSSVWKWPGAFYCGAIMGVVWVITWTLTVTNSPKDAKFMKVEERAYLERSLGSYKAKKKNFKTPWLKLFTSLPVLSCITCGFSTFMVAVIMQIYLPTFFKEILFLKVVDNGLYSALPFLVQFFVKLLWSLFLDALKKRKLVSNTAACKLSQGIASSMIIIFLVLLGYLPDCRHPWIAVMLVCGIAGGFGIGINGFYVSMLSLAPAYTGTLSSINMILGFVGMITTPQMVSFFRVYGILEEWRVIFLIIASLTVVTGIFFVICGEAEPQAWAKVDPVGAIPEKLLAVEEDTDIITERNMQLKRSDSILVT